MQVHSSNTFHLKCGHLFNIINPLAYSDKIDLKWPFLNRTFIDLEWPFLNHTLIDLEWPFLNRTFSRKQLGLWRQMEVVKLAVKFGQPRFEGVELAVPPVHGPVEVIGVVLGRCDVDPLHFDDKDEVLLAIFVCLGGQPWDGDTPSRQVPVLEDAPEVMMAFGGRGGYRGRQRFVLIYIVLVLKAHES